MTFELILACAIVGAGGLAIGALGTILWALTAAEKERGKDENC